MSGKRIVVANRGLAFDGDTVHERPIGGVELATAMLAEALARRGHDVAVHGNVLEERSIRGVAWRSLDRLPLRADLYIANRNHELLLKVPFARKRALWLHNPAWTVDDRRFRAKMMLLPPEVIVLGEYHRSTCPTWMERFNIKTIPLGLADSFLHRDAVGTAPLPNAIFTSNPARNLDWLLRVWAERIWPRMPDARLHLYSGPQVYQLSAGTGFTLMNTILARADALADHGVVRHLPVSRMELVGHVAAARVMLYRGHEEETFCLALAEAQALGVPCVVQRIGSTAERVRHGATGVVAEDEDAFVEGAVRLLQDGATWLAMHRASLALQRDRIWDRVAQDFEALFA